MPNLEHKIFALRKIELTVGIAIARFAFETAHKIIEVIFCFLQDFSFDHN